MHLPALANATHADGMPTHWHVVAGDAVMCKCFFFSCGGLGKEPRKVTTTT